MTCGSVHFVSPSPEYYYTHTHTYLLTYMYMYIHVAYNRTHVCVYYNLCINLSCCILCSYMTDFVQRSRRFTLFLFPSFPPPPILLYTLAVTNAKRATNCLLLIPKSQNFQLQNVHMIGMMITCLKVHT